MIEFLKVIINFLSKKEVYGTIITLSVAYFFYKTIIIILEELINAGKSSYEIKKRTTITKLFKNIVRYVILIIAIIVILSIFGVNVKGIVAGLGVTATIVGLALQDTFKDIINGISIIMENYFVVGDYVTYNNFTGEVIEFGLKSTKIRNANGEVKIVANRNILEIQNLSELKQVVTITIPLPYEEEPDRMEKIIKQNILTKIKRLDNVYKDSVTYLGINELADSSVNYLINFTCKRDTQWQAKRDVNKIILSELQKEKVSIPYPQLEVHYEK